MERKAAKAFGAKRQIGSGSLGRSDRSRSDSTHERLFLECKYSKRHAIVSLWDKTNEYAKREKKTPVVILAIKGRPGHWYLIKDKDLKTVAGELELVGLSDVGNGEYLKPEGKDDGNQEHESGDLKRQDVQASDQGQ